MDHNQDIAVRAFTIRSPRRTLGLFLLVFMVSLSACEDDSGAYLLAQKAKEQWDAGRYADAARNYATLAEVHPNHHLAEDALFWAANLYHHFLETPDEAIRFYQALLVRFPKGTHTLKAQESLAELFNANKRTRHRALQTYQQLLLSEGMKERRDEILFEIASINLKMGALDQARFEMRELITKYPKSSFLPEAYYLVGYSYFLEQRQPLALVAFRDAVKKFPGTPTASRAQFFVAEILEEQGKLGEALKAFMALKGKYHNEKVLEKRIASLQTRLRKGVR